MSVITAVSWAVLAIALKYGLHFASSGTIAWIRMVIAFLCLFAFYTFRSQKKLSILVQPPIAAVFAGLALALNYWGYMKGVELTNASTAQLMIQLAPMTLVLIGIFYFKETPSSLQTLGFISALCGFILFYWDQVLVHTTDHDQFATGNLWIIAAAAGWAIFAAIQKVLLSRYSAQQFNMLIYGISVVALAPLVHFGEILSWNFWVWMLMIAMGLNTLIAYGALSEAIKRIPASHVSIIITANPLLTIFLMAVLTYIEVRWIEPEPIAWRGFLGAGLVVCGVALTVWKKRVQGQGRV